MFERLINWFISRDEDDSAPRASALSRSGAFKPAQIRKPAAIPRTAPRTPVAGRSADPGLKIAAGLDGEIADLGPGKNVLVRSNPHRDDSGTHETLSIVEDSIVPTGAESGIDPYNTGKFDRSRNWDKRFR